MCCVCACVEARRTTAAHASFFFFCFFCLQFAVANKVAIMSTNEGSILRWNAGSEIEGLLPAALRLAVAGQLCDV